jgi:hypothetical protein
LILEYTHAMAAKVDQAMSAAAAWRVAGQGQIGSAGTMAKRASVCQHGYTLGEMTLRIATTILALLIGAGSAATQWQDATETDPKGKQIVMRRTPGKGAISKSGREVSSNLYLRCDNPYENRVTYRGHDYWSAFVLFSEPVSSVEARTRYSFDGGETTQSTFMFDQGGTALFFTQQEDEDNDFIKRLAGSTSLQINPILKLAGSPIITFETEGATTALRQIPCNKKF